MLVPKDTVRKELQKLENLERLAFGPVPSRRLGRSLGINNIPAKFCSYACVYCQVGKTLNMTVKRQPFYDPDDVFKRVEEKFVEASTRNDRVDYLTFVPDGEPTLDKNLDQEIRLLKQIDTPIAVLTNSSLISRNDVQNDLMNADLVSLKVDAVTRDLWKRINRPHKKLRLRSVLRGITEFAEEFNGEVISETMLVDSIHYGKEFEKIAEFLRQLKSLDKAYVAIPTRPPTLKWAKPAKEAVINTAFQVFAEKLGAERVEYLIGYEGDAFASTGKPEDDLLSITSVHPMRRSAVTKLLEKNDADWHLIEKLLKENKLVQVEYGENEYYMRKF